MISFLQSIIGCGRTFTIVLHHTLLLRIEGYAPSLCIEGYVSSLSMRSLILRRRYSDMTLE